MDQGHEDIKQLVAAYVLGGLPRDEEAAVRAHIASCDDCLAEADALGETAAVLVHAVEPVGLPSGFADAVMAKALPEPEVLQPRRRRRLIAAWVGAAALVFGMGAGLIDARRELAERERLLAAALRADGMTLTGPGGARARMVPADGGGLFVVAGLDEAPEGRVYQLWLLDDGHSVSAGTFEVHGGVVGIEVDRPLEGVDGVAVTLEPEGGSPQPTGPRILAS